MKEILKKTNIVSYLFMIVGVCFLFYNEMNQKSQTLIIVGLSFLVIGIYNLSKKLSPKK